MHSNAIWAGLCKLPKDYEYLSAQFYERMRVRGMKEGLLVNTNEGGDTLHDIPLATHN